MERKTDAVKRLVAEGDYHSALRIARNFKLGISECDIADMKRGYESELFPEFYRSIGQNPDLNTQKGVETLIRLYG